MINTSYITLRFNMQEGMIWGKQKGKRSVVEESGHDVLALAFYTFEELHFAQVHLSYGLKECQATLFGLLFHLPLQLPYEGQFLLVGRLTSLENADDCHVPRPPEQTSVLPFSNLDPRRQVISNIIHKIFLPLITDEIDPPILIIVLEIQTQIAWFFLCQKTVAVEYGLQIALLAVAEQKFILFLYGQDAADLHLPLDVIKVVFKVSLLGGIAGVIEHVQQRQQAIRVVVPGPENLHHPKDSFPSELALIRLIEQLLALLGEEGFEGKAETAFILDDLADDQPP